MAKHPNNDPVLTKPLPSTGTPFFVTLCLIACIVLAHKYFFGEPTHLLGGPPPSNQYIHMMITPKPKPKPKPVINPAQPAADAQKADGDAQATSDHKPEHGEPNVRHIPMRPTDGTSLD